MDFLETITRRKVAFADAGFSAALKIIPSTKKIIIGCLDPRVDPIDILELQHGEAASLRNIGGRINSALVDTMVLLPIVTKAAGQETGPGWNLLILQHSQCPDLLPIYVGVTRAELDQPAITKCESSAELGRDSSAGRSNCPPTQPSAATLSATASRILDEVRVALPHDLAAASLSATRLALLLRESVAVPPRAVPSKGRLASWQERKVRDYVEANIGSSILVEDLAGIVSLSAAHFCRAFKKSFRATPHAYIVSRRVERAQELMRTTRTPLSQIALDCGFADQTHLSKLFRRLTGRTPNNWRRAYTSES